MQLYLGHGDGQPWGLFLAMEEPEESFARRCFGEDHGQLYKPDYRSLQAENADVALRYTGDDPGKYENIFRNAKFKISPVDQGRLIQALKVLSSGEELEQAVNVDEVLRYFAVQVFSLNLGSYIGPTGHNYFLYEKDGVQSILPWDYNLAFGTYCMGMTDSIRDPTAFCTYEDHLTAVETLINVCGLRAQSIRRQLSGSYPSTFREQMERPSAGVDASPVRLQDLGDFEDLKAAKGRNDAALAAIL